MMDMAPLILILTPILLPVITSIGVDPVHFGMIMMVNLGIGLLTPPVGGVLFVGAAVAKLPMEQVVKALRELGADPANGRSLTVKDGRFGPYITDGETNVTVPRGTSIETLTLDRAAELMAEKRAKGPAPKKRTRSRSRS